MKEIGCNSCHELHIEIDYREKSVIKLIQDNPKFPFKYTILNLTIGDFIIKQNDETLYILERKTILDLAASITDGRFREQKQRLFESVNGNYDKIIYIIEGKKNLKQYGSISKTILDSSILNLMFKHKYRVMYTLDETDTLDMITQLCNKLQKKEFDKPISTEVKAIKKGTNMDGYINILCTIPGISNIVAKKIKEKYNSLVVLFDAYKSIEDKDKESRYYLLSDIQINKRKIGKILSKKIYCHLFSETEISENKEECLL